MKEVEKRIKDLEQKIYSLQGVDPYFKRLLELIPNLTASDIEELEIFIFSENVHSWQNVYDGWSK